MNRKLFDPGPLAKVELQSKGNRKTLIFVRDLGHPPEKVWKALTDPDQLAKWAPFTPDRNLSTIGPATLRMIDGHKVETFPSTVLKSSPPTLLEFTWGDDLLTWELEPKGDGTQLTLRHTVENQDWVPRTAAGWHLCLYVAEKLLEGNPIGPIVGHEAKKYGWERLNEAYANVLGIPSSGWPEAEFPES